GRGDLAPFSDIDLLILHNARRTTQMKQLAERLLRLLCDAGLTVGNSFRTVRECLTARLSDLHLETALTTMRLLAGSGDLLDSLFVALDRDRRKRSRTCVDGVLKERAERFGKFGDAVCLKEPNVKAS